MADIRRSPAKAPEYARHRDGATTADVIATVVKEHGMNMDGHEWANVQVVPGALMNPSVAVVWWSDAANGFVQEHVPISKAGVGNGVPYEFSVRCLSRIMFVALVGGPYAAGVDVHVSGYGVEHR